MQPKE